MGFLSYIKYGVMIVPLIVAGTLYWKLNSLEGDYESLLIENTELRVERDGYKNMYEDAQNSFQKQSERLEKLSTATVVLQEENNRLQSVLEGYKNREETVKAKPTLVERRANVATKRLMCEYARVTSSTSAEEDCN